MANNFQIRGTEYVPNFGGSEMFTTISETYELHSGSMTVQLRCKWEDRHQVITKFLEGGNRSEPAELPSELQWQTSGTPLLASSVRIEPMQTTYKADGQAIVYKYALVTLTYQMMATDIDIQSTTQWLQIYPTGLYWKISNGNGGYDKVQVAQDEVPGIKFPSYDITLSHPHIKSKFAGGSFCDYEGYVNSDHIQVWYNGVELEFQPETLLCTSPSIKAGANLCGSGFNNISLKLSYNPLTHNKFFNPKQNMGDPTASLESHAVEMYVDDEQGERRISIFPSKPFAPIFEAFKCRVLNLGNGGGSENTPSQNADNSTNEQGGE